MVNGPAWKALIEEEFGDGIMSGSTSTLLWSALRTQGDRRQDHMSGKFLPYKYYGASGQHSGVWVQGGLSGRGAAAPLSRVMPAP